MALPILPVILNESSKMKMNPVIFLIPIDTEDLNNSGATRQEISKSLEFYEGSTIVKWNLKENYASRRVESDDSQTKILHTLSIELTFKDIVPECRLKSKVNLRILDKNDIVKNEMTQTYSKDDRTTNWVDCFKFSNAETNFKIQIEFHTYGVVFVSNFQELLNRQLMTDVKISVKGEILKAHRSFLMAGSLVFKSMFSYTMKEASTGMIKIDDCSSIAIKEMLNFIYTGTVSSKGNVEYWKELYKAADKYNINDLIDICDYELTSQLTISNCVDLIQFAYRYKANLLKYNGRHFISENLQTLKKNEKFLNMTKLVENLEITRDLLLIEGIPKDLFMEQQKIQEINSDKVYWDLLNDEVTADVRIVTTDMKTFKAHKCVLAGRSVTFHALFNDPEIHEIKIDLDEKCVRGILVMIYTGQIDQIENRPIELFKFATKYKLKDLKDLCERNLMKLVSIQNAIELFELAVSNSAFGLKREVFRFINKNESQVRITNQFIELSKNPDVMRELVENNKYV